MTVTANCLEFHDREKPAAGPVSDSRLVHVPASVYRSTDCGVQELPVVELPLRQGGVDGEVGQGGGQLPAPVGGDHLVTQEQLQPGCAAVCRNLESYSTL